MSSTTPSSASSPDGPARPDRGGRRARRATDDGEWALLLRAAAGPATIAVEALPAGAAMTPFAIAALGGPRSDPPPEALRREAAPDARLWWAALGAGDVADLLVDRPGPLLEQGLYRTIEVWTETELCCLHALGRLARLPGGDAAAARLRTVRAWHLEHTQPDNATNRPWAVHLFLREAGVEGRLYAETLLHNASSAGPEMEPLSALILHDAARELDRTGSAPGHEPSDPGRGDRGDGSAAGR